MSDQTASRRDFLRRAGTVAWTTPFILTMTARTAHAQTSCAPAGTACGVWSDTLQTCLPVAPPVVCCGTCEFDAVADPQFCLCVGG